MVTGDGREPSDDLVVLAMLKHRAVKAAAARQLGMSPGRLGRRLARIARTRKWSRPPRGGSRVDPSTIEDPEWRAYHGATEGDDSEARNRLVIRYRPLAQYHWHRYVRTLPPGADFDAFWSAAHMALLWAIATFDPGAGVEFSTYATHRICGAMADEARRQDTVRRVHRGRITRRDALVEQLAHRLGRRPSTEEIERELIAVYGDEARGRPATDWRHRHQVRLGFGDEEDAGPWGDEPAADPVRHDRAPLDEMETLRELTRGLSKRDRLIVIEYYWLDVTMKEIGAGLDLSESRVSQIHSACLAEMRQQLEGK